MDSCRIPLGDFKWILTLDRKFLALCESTTIFIILHVTKVKMTNLIHIRTVISSG